MKKTVIINGIELDAAKDLYDDRWADEHKEKLTAYGGRVLKDEFILPTKKRASDDHIGCSFAFEVQ